MKDKPIYIKIVNICFLSWCLLVRMKEQNFTFSFISKLPISAGLKINPLWADATKQALKSFIQKKNKHFYSFIPTANLANRH